MQSKFNFSYKKAISLNTIMLVLTTIAIVVSFTLAFFYNDDQASSMLNMSGKVKIEAVGEGETYSSIEDTHTSNLIITLDQDYEVVIPGMEIGIDANCKVYKSNTSPLLRARVDFELVSALTGDAVSDNQTLVSDLYEQMITVIQGNNWYLHSADGYFYYLGDVVQPTGAKNGDLLLKEIDVTADNKVINFIDKPIKFPERITSDYSGLAVVFKITFQGIQNYIPDSEGFQLDNTIDNAQKIFDAFTNVYTTTTRHEYFSYTTSGSDVIINPAPNMIFTENINLPSTTPDGTVINVIGDGFRGNSQIKSLSVPSSYNKIMPNAFQSSTLVTADLSKSNITEIPSSCFMDTDLTKIMLPNTVVALRENCLYNTKLSSISFPTSLTTIENGALFNAPLTSLFIPETLTNIGNDIFNSAYLVKIVVDSSNPNYKDSGEIMMLSKDGKELMLCASILTSSSLEVPNTVETVSSYALYNAKARHVYFHEKVETIEDNAFSTLYLEELEIENTNPYFSTDGTAVFNANQTHLIVVIDRNISSYTIPASVTKIYGSAFANANIDTLNIGASVSSIDPTTFDYMTVTSIIVNSSNSYFKDDGDVSLLNKAGTILYKYANKNTKTSYSIPSTVTTIERYAFYNADALTSVTLNTNLDYINDGAFSYCGGLSTITLPSGIISTGYQAFYNSSVSTVTLSGTVGVEAFSGCVSLNTATINNTTTILDSAVFKNCSAINSVEFKNTTPPTIYGDLFEGVSSSFSIKVPSASVDIFKALIVLNSYKSKIVSA